MRAYLEAYGCTLNFGEAREIEDLLLGKGWELTSSPDESDLAVLVTCVVIETTERKMLKRLKELSKARLLVVTGCMATACREKAERIAPRAIFIPPGDLGSFSRFIGNSSIGRAGSIPARESFSIVPIATGCRGTCSYCITRLARRELKSRPKAQIVEAVRKASVDGPREIQLTAQDTAAYGLDIGLDLPDLVVSICELPQDFRLRVGMMNPKNAGPIVRRIADAFAQKKVFKFLHLPIQSASDRLLKHMGRGYTVSEYNSIVREMREKLPLLSLSTDLIVGYPGETADDHEANIEFISQIQPDIVNVTRFSARPGTKAARAPEQIVGWKAKDRSREITKIRFEVAETKNRRWIGKNVIALATERGKKESTILRNDEYKQIVVAELLPLGGYFEVEITDATPTYLIGCRTGI